MVDEESNEGSGDNQDNTDGYRNKAEDIKTEILSNVQSMMPGEHLGIGWSTFTNLRLVLRKEILCEWSRQSHHGG